MSRQPRSKSQLIQGLVRARKGEGVLITTVHRPMEKGSGRSISLDLSSAPVPERRYAADSAWIELDDDLARLYLAQRKAISNGIQSILLVRIPFLGLRQFLKSMPSLVENAKAFMTRIGAKSIRAIDTTEPPNQTFTVDANIIAAAFSGRESCLDLYHVSPYVIHGLKNGGDFYAEPVARINLATQLLLDIFDYLESNKKLIPVDEDEVPHE